MKKKIRAFVRFLSEMSIRHSPMKKTSFTWVGFEAD